MPRPFLAFPILVVLAGAGAEAAQRTPRFFSPGFSRQDIDVGAVAERLAQRGVRLPPVKGRVSFSVQAAIPWSQLLNGSAYELDGTLRSPRLEVAGLVLDKLEAQVRLRERVLRLDPLRFEVGLSRPGAAPAGTFLGRAAIDMRPSGRLTASVDFRDVPWGDLLRFFGGLDLELVGKASGTANLDTALTQLLDPAAAKVALTIHAADARWHDFAATNGAANLTMENRTIILRAFSFMLAQAPVSGSGQLSLARGDFNLTVASQGIALTALARMAGTDPSSLHGTLDLAANATGNLSPFKLDASGTLTGRELGTGPITSPLARLEFRSNGKSLDVRNLNARLWNGDVTGGGSFDFASTRFRGELTAEGVDLGEGTRSASLPALPEVRGVLAAKFSVEGQAAPFSIAAQGSALASGVRMGNTKPMAMNADFRADQQRARLTKLTATILDGALTADASLDPRTRRLTAKVQLERLSLAELKAALGDRIPFDLAGRVRLTSDIQADLAAATLSARGGIEGKDLVVAEVECPTVHLGYALDQNGVAIRELDARVFAGTLRGSAQIPRDPSGIWAIDVAAEKWDLAPIGRTTLGNSAGMSGHFDARIRGQLTPGAQTRDRRATGEATITAQQLTLFRVPVRQVTGSVNADGKQIAYKLAAGLLDGAARLEGTSPLFDAQSSRPTLTGHARLERLRLRPLAEALSRQRIPITGELNAALDYSHIPGELFPKGSGRFTVSEIRRGTEPLVGALTGEILLNHWGLRVQNLSGRAFGGALRANASAELSRLAEPTFQVVLARAELGALTRLAPGVPSLPGIMNLNVRGRVGREITASGVASVPRTQYENIPMASLRVPFDLRIAPRTGRGRVTLHQANVNVARGRVGGDLAIELGRERSIRGSLDYASISLDDLLKQVLGSAQAASGNLSGHATVTGERLRSLADARVLLRGRLDRAAAQQIPVVNRILPYVQGVTAGVGAPIFDHGDYEANYSGGLLTISNLELDGQSLRLLVSGSVNVRGRLALNVVASSGPRALAQRAIRAVAAKFLLATVPPLAIVEANQLLADRIIYLTVEGTIQSPVIRVQPVPTLTAEAIRFLLRGVL